MPLCNFGEVVVFLRIVLFLFRNQALDKQILYAFTRREGSLHDIVSIECAWGQRIHSAACHGFYCGYRAALNLIDDNPYVLHISPLYHALIKLTNRYGINTIINYNYDDTFYHALCECGYKFRNHYKNMDTHGDKRIYYPHGYIPMKGGVVTDIVLSEDDYQETAENSV